MATVNGTATLAGSGVLGLISQPVQTIVPPSRQEAAQANTLNRVLAAPATSGAGSFFAVTKSDTVPLPPGVRGLWVGGAGAVAVTGVFDTIPVTLSAVPAGTFIPGRFGYVMSTNTSATAIVAFLG